MLLLDTHALVWLATDLTQLPEPAKSAIRFHASELYVSSISSLEVSMLTKAGKLKWGRNPLSKFEQALKHHGVKEVPMDHELAWKSGQLPLLHLDPFDRIIVATAHKFGMTILTKDRTIPTYPKTKVIWE